MQSRNTLPGYEVSGAQVIPDEEDPGVGFAAGDRVLVNEEHEMYPGEEGTVQAVMKGQGWYAGSIVIDVLIDGCEDAERLRPHEIEGI